MDYKEFNGDCDITNVEAVLKKLQDYLNLEDTDPAVKLYGIKTIIDANGQQYINSLKNRLATEKKAKNKLKLDFDAAVRKVEKRDKEITELKEIIARKKEKENKQKEEKKIKETMPKKKVIVVKRKATI